MVNYRTHFLAAGAFLYNLKISNVNSCLRSAAEICFLEESSVVGVLEQKYELIFLGGTV
jgi:hypothetical protein